MERIVLKEFKEAYEKAVKENKEVFIFEGKEVLTTYAKYIIKYLEKE
jgi:hypothetical protein